MNFNPHDYQDYAIRYIEKHPVAAVLLDMGLGKTIISLTAVYDLLFDSFEVHRVLVVAPLRVARDTWPAEIQKWEHLSRSYLCGRSRDTEGAKSRPHAASRYHDHQP
jgi:superfamily II DNA or RNA helicase